MAACWAHAQRLSTYNALSPVPRCTHSHHEPHFAGRETEAQSGDMGSPRSARGCVAKAGFESGLLDFLESCIFLRENYSNCDPPTPPWHQLPSNAQNVESRTHMGNEAGVYISAQLGLRCVTLNKLVNLSMPVAPSAGSKGLL